MFFSQVLSKAVVVVVGSFRVSLVIEGWGHWWDFLHRMLPRHHLPALQTFNYAILFFFLIIFFSGQIGIPKSTLGFDQEELQKKF